MSGSRRARLGVFVLYFVVSLVLRQLSLDPDSIAFLYRIDVAGFADLMHPLYVPVLRILRPLFLGESQFCAQAFSAFMGAVFVVGLWRLLDAVGVRSFVALPAALLVALAQPFWSSAVNVEVYTPANGALVSALVFAEAYGRQPAWWKFALVLVAGIFATGFHAFTFLGAPAAFYLMGWTRGRLNRRQLIVLVSAAVVVPVGLYFALGTGIANIRNYLHFASAFLPDPDSLDSPLTTLARNANSAFSFLWTSPLLAVLFVPAVLVAWRRYPRVVRFSLIWALTFLVAFLIVRVSFWGLLLPAQTALAVGVAGGAQAIVDRGRRIPTVLCAIVLWGGVGGLAAGTLPPIYEASRKLNQYEEMAMLIADVVPAGISVFASGHVAMQLEFFTEVRSVSLERVNRILQRDNRAIEPEQRKTVLQVLAERARAEAAEGYKPFLTSDAIIFLGTLGYDDMTPLVTGDPPVMVRSENVLVKLFPMRTDAR